MNRASALCVTLCLVVVAFTSLGCWGTSEVTPNANRTTFTPSAMPEGQPADQEPVRITKKPAKSQSPSATEAPSDQ